MTRQADVMSEALLCLQIHWFSIINSCVTVLLLTGFLATILMRVLKKDFVKYTRDDEGISKFLPKPQPDGYGHSGHIMLAMSFCHKENQSEKPEFACLMTAVKQRLYFANVCVAVAAATTCMIQYDMALYGPVEHLQDAYVQKQGITCGCSAGRQRGDRLEVYPWRCLQVSASQKCLLCFCWHWGSGDALHIPTCNKAQIFMLDSSQLPLSYTVAVQCIADKCSECWKS